ncbi:MAG: hypothetical protein KKD38_01330, partial [Candidatus Delongbacteria bacterium]|nr:hypothetical protein [Candidatus Delongbacteria bacterium]
VKDVLILNVVESFFIAMPVICILPCMAPMISLLSMNKVLPFYDEYVISKNYEFTDSEIREIMKRNGAYYDPVIKVDVPNELASYFEAVVVTGKYRYDLRSLAVWEIDWLENIKMIQKRKEYLIHSEKDRLIMN